MWHRHQSANERTFDPTHAERLDDPARRDWLPPGRVVAELRLQSGMNVGDIGAGTGYFALPIARAIRPGFCYAVDFEPRMLELLRDRSVGESNLALIHGEAAATTLPDSCCDVALLANIWHELDDHVCVLTECRRILSPRGRVAILDWRPDVVQPPGPPLDHRISASTVERSLATNGWNVDRSVAVGTYSYLVIATSSLNE